MVECEWLGRPHRGNDFIFVESDFIELEGEEKSLSMEFLPAFFSPVPKTLDFDCIKKKNIFKGHSIFLYAA